MEPGGFVTDPHRRETLNGGHGKVAEGHVACLDETGRKRETSQVSEDPSFKFSGWTFGTKKPDLLEGWTFLQDALVCQTFGKRLDEVTRNLKTPLR